VVVLAVLGGARTHLQSFVLFVAVVVVLAAAVVAVFVTTAGDAETAPGGRGDQRG
jgi:hypothetical protein